MPLLTLSSKTVDAKMLEVEVSAVPVSSVICYCNYDSPESKRWCFDMML